MPDNAAVLQRTLIAKESTAGTAPASGWRQLGSLEFIPTPEMAAETFKPNGLLWNTVGGVNQESTKLALRGRGTYTELPYVLNGLIKDVTPTTPGSAVLSRLWSYAPSQSTEDTPATYAVERGTSGRNEESTYTLITGCQFQYSRNGGLQLSGNAVGQLLRDNAAVWMTAAGTASSGTAIATLTFTDTPATPIITVPIAYNATAGTVQTALRSLITIGSSGVSVTGSAGGPWTVTFDGTKTSGRLQDVLVLSTNSLTGGTNPSLGIVHTTPGAEAATNDVQTLTLSGTPTGGSFRLKFATSRAKSFAYSASAATIQTQLLTAAALTTGDVSVTGGALGTNPVRIAFAGTYVEAPPPVLTLTDTFDAGSPTLSTLPTTYTSYTLSPILGKHFSWYFARSYAGLDTASKLTRMLAASWQVGDRWGVFFPMNSDNASFAGHVADDPKAEVSFTLGADSTGMELMTDLRRGDIVFLRGYAQGPVIETISGTAYRQYFQADLAILLTGISERKAEQKLLAVTYTGTLAYDSTMGSAMSLLVQNTLTAL